jgi:hypothetical protein
MKEFLSKIQTEMRKHKKALCVALGAVLVLSILSVGFHAIFEVEGVVTAKTNQSITVANFFRTQTINLSGAPVDISTIKTGQEIQIHKNLQGEVLSIRADNRDQGHGKDFGEHERDRH